MDELQALPNIGPVLAKNLRRAGICTPEALRALGAEEAFLRIRTTEPTACLHMLEAIAGAVEGVRKSVLSPGRKAELRTFFQSL